MTDDGTKGDKVTEAIRKSKDRFLFLKNGVDMVEAKESKASDDIQTLIDTSNDYEYNFISVSRLQSWKRLDRSIQVFEAFLKTNPNCRYIIVGDGEKKLMLEEYVRANSLTNNIIFTGGIGKSDINHLMKNSDIFLSHYELSNVGNPLWEAISNECLVVTLANGDTGLVIEDGISGIISAEANYMDNVKKLNELLVSPSKVAELIANGTAVLHRSVTSWDDRMMAELSKVEALQP
jgi:glycosyltransferase involved in cell wall biosynthesis